MEKLVQQIGRVQAGSQVNPGREEHAAYDAYRWRAYWSAEMMLRAEHPEWSEDDLAGAVVDWLAERAQV